MSGEWGSWVRLQEGMERAGLSSEGLVEMGAGCTRSHLESPLMNWQGHYPWFWWALRADGHARPYAVEALFGAPGKNG